MKCPLDGADLVMTERQGIEIDYCPKCRGVWLDRGELDKIVERAAGEAPQAAAFQPRPQQQPPQQPYPPQQAYPERGHYDDDDYRDRARYKDKYDPRYKKRRGFLGDLFDFD